MPRRRDRLKQFGEPPGGAFAFTSFYPDLLSSAHTLLERALLDRRTSAKTDRTHSSVHGAGAIVLQVTAFDVWMGELLATMFLPFEEARGRLDKPILEKCRFLHEKNHQGVGTPAPPIEDLEIVVQVRDEIVHHFIRPNPHLVPEWLAPLQERGLVLTSGDATVDFTLSAKLGSYGLAYWAVEVVESCVAAINSPGRHFDLENFRLYRRICPPSDLASFDRPDQ